MKNFCFQIFQRQPKDDLVDWGKVLALDEVTVSGVTTENLDNNNVQTILKQNITGLVRWTIIGDSNRLTIESMNSSSQNVVVYEYLYSGSAPAFKRKRQVSNC